MNYRSVAVVCILGCIFHAGTGVSEQADRSGDPAAKPATGKNETVGKRHPLLASFQDGKPVVAVFGARSCCSPDPMADVAMELQARQSNVAHVVYMDAFRERDFALKCGVETIPTVFMFDGQGTEKAKLTEPASVAELEKKMTEVGLK